MVKCLICNIEKNCSIVEHLKYEHKMTCSEYKKLYPSAKVKSESFSKKLSENAKKNWTNDEYRNKQIKIRNITHKDPKFREKMSEKIKKIHKETPNIFSGFTNWSKSDKFKEWVKSEERIKKISNKSLEFWKNEDYRTKIIKRLKEVLSDGRCNKNREFREKMSETISKLYSEGNITNNSNKYKTGIFKDKKGEEFFYASSYEYDAMRIFDNSPNVKLWTNKHGIKIKYHYNNLFRNYIPDFYVEFINGLSFIIEMKGWITEEVEVKEFYTKKTYKNYKIFYSIKDLEKFVNENC